MRMCFTLLLAASLLLPVLPLHAEKPPTEQQRAAALVAQLASDDFQVRENAAGALDRLGATALPALQAASHDPDPEVRRRVVELLNVIERRVETARQFEAPRLRLQYKNSPLVEVLADLSKRSGNPVKLGSDNSEVLGKRTVTLDGEWTFWEALARVCEVAGVAEPEPEPASPPSSPYIEEGGFRARGRRMMFLDQARTGRPASEPEPITLLNGKPASRSIFQSGALRIRMLGPRASCPADSGGDKKHAPLTLEIKPEPRISWERLAAVRIDRVLDNHEQILPAPPPVFVESKLQDLPEDVIIVWDGHSDFPLTPTPQVFLLQFPVNDRTGKSLREVRGTVAGWIRTSPEPLITIDNIAKVLNRPQIGPEGCRVKVIDCQREADGLYKVQIELTPTRSPTLAQFLNQRVVRMNRRFGFVERVITPVEAATLPFVLSTEKGETLSLVNGTFEKDSNGQSGVYNLVYKPDKNENGPAKLVYRDRRCAFVEVSFTLKDVPLYNEK